MCVMKKDGALQNEVKKGGALQNEGIVVIYEGRSKKKYSDKKTGATAKKWCRRGIGSEEFDRSYYFTYQSNIQKYIVFLRLVAPTLCNPSLRVVVQDLCMFSSEVAFHPHRTQNTGSSQTTLSTPRQL